MVSCSVVGPSAPVLYRCGDLRAQLRARRHVDAVDPRLAAREQRRALRQAGREGRGPAGAQHHERKHEPAAAAQGIWRASLRRVKGVYSLVCVVERCIAVS